MYDNNINLQMQTINNNKSNYFYDNKDAHKDPAKSISQELAADFYKIFLKEALQPMDEDSMFGGGHAERQYHEMFIDELAQQMVKDPDSSLVNQIYAKVQKNM